MKTTAPSLQRSFAKMVVPPLLLGMLMVAVFGYLSIKVEIDEVYDASLVQFAKILAQTAAQDVEDGTPIEISIDSKDPALEHEYERNVSFRILHGQKILAQSIGARRFTDLELTKGFSDQRINGSKWRFFVYEDDKTGLTVQIAEKNHIRAELANQLIGSLLVPGILFAAVTLLIVWRGAGLSLRRLISMSEQVDRRDADDLTPIEDPMMPREIEPLLRALNRLFGRVDKTLRLEKEFTDNAAHELRTPLAAMKTQTQVLLRSENFTPAGRDGFLNLQAAIDRTVAMVEGLMSIARLQSDDVVRENIDLSVFVVGEVDGFSSLGLFAGHRIKMQIEPGIHIDGVPSALTVMLRNVIQNAAKFSPEGSEITVTLAKAGPDVLLSVADQGPGIDDVYKEKVFNRFFRISKSAASGSGLGLAMVKLVADMHDARITLTDIAPHGLCVSFAFKAS